MCECVWVRCEGLNAKEINECVHAAEMCVCINTKRVME